MIQKVLGIGTGTLKGKKAVEDYWRAALQKMPDLKFSLLEVTSGVDSVSLYYDAVLGKRAIETFFFNRDGKVFKALAAYNRPSFHAAGKSHATVRVRSQEVCFFAILREWERQPFFLTLIAEKCLPRPHRVRRGRAIAETAVPDFQRSALKKSGTALIREDSRVKICQRKTKKAV